MDSLPDDLTQFFKEINIVSPSNSKNSDNNSNSNSSDNNKLMCILNGHVLVNDKEEVNKFIR